MRNRWRALFFSALTGLAGVSWMARDLGFSLASFLWLQLLGLVLAAGFAFYGIVSNTRHKWPAAVALLCIAPLGQQLLSILGTPIAIVQLLAILGLGGLLFFGGSIATIGIAIYILAKRTPAAPDAIARAEVRQ